MTVLKETIEALVPGKIFLETGTYLADTLRSAIAAGALAAYSCDISREHVDKYAGLNVSIQDSPAWLAEMLPRFAGQDLVILLDAHTGTESPLLAELEVIGNREYTTILIDDWRYVVDKKMPWGFNEIAVLFLLGSCHCYLIDGETGEGVSKDVLVVEK